MGLRTVQTGEGFVPFVRCRDGGGHGRAAAERSHKIERMVGEMPTERFYHLSEEKKRLIREAAIKEFCRVPLEKVSINKIVQNAEISRGSFYTYFRDKEDVLEYIFEDVISQIQNFCDGVLEKNQGDFWALPLRLFDYTMEICEANKMFALAQSTFGNRAIAQMLDAKSNGRGCLLASGQSEDEITEDEKLLPGQMGIWLKKLYCRTDCARMNIGSFSEFYALFSLCMMNMMAAIGEIYQRGDDKDVAKLMFGKRLEIIRHGASKCR